MKAHTDRYGLFVQDILQDALFICFILVVLSLFRAAFLVVFAGDLQPDTTRADLALTLWYGLRLSLKTAGALVLPCFVFGTLLRQIFPRWNSPRWRLIWAGVCVTVLSVLFESRLAYYQEFHNAFSPFVFNTFHDDVGAVVQTAMVQYHAVGRLLLAALYAAAGTYVFSWVLKAAGPLSRPLLRLRCKRCLVIGVCVALVPLAVFLRKGGSFTYNGSIYWKNAARMQQHLLNEAILDDVQALYKASRIYKQFSHHADSLTADTVRQAAARLMGTEQYTADTLEELLQRRAPGPAMAKPRHIVVIVAETYMLWPLLDGYQNLPLANGLRRLIAEKDSIFLDHFMPASNGTMFGLTSVLLGLPEVNLLTANRPTAQEPYETALSVQLRQQGYKTRFFYGGFPSWENVGAFAAHQQLDESFYYADFGGSGGVWGVPDKSFLRQTAEKITDEPSFNLVLTSSNHPPFTVDMSQETALTPRETLRHLLPAQEAHPELMLDRMQHFEYADHYLTEFVQTVRAKYPDTLFIITGDHADRWTLSPNPSTYERLFVPLVLIGPGLSQDLAPAQTAGSHMDVAATVLELVLPAGTPYYALGRNVLGGQPAGVHAYYWNTAGTVTDFATGQSEALPGAAAPLSDEQRARLEQYVKDIQTVAAWRILHGLSLKS